MASRQNEPRLLYFLNSFDRGGAELGLICLAENGLFNGFELEIASIVRGTGGIEEKLEEMDINCRVLVDRPKMRMFDLPIAYLKLRQLIRRKKPSIVIASLPQANLLARLAVSGSRKTILVSFEHNIQLSRPIYESLFRATSRSVDWLFSDSDVTAHAALKSRYTVVPRRRSVVPLLCLDDDLLVHPPRRDAQFHIVSAARFTRAKNLESVVKALVILKERGRNVRCTLFGEGPRAAEYRHIADQGGVSDRFDLPGFVPDWVTVPADAFVLASHNEGLCIAMIEAMNAGIPAVAPMVGGLSDYADEETMEVVGSPTPEELADALSKIIDDPARAKRKASAAQMRVSQLFGRTAVRLRLTQINQQIHDSIRLF